MCWTPKYDHFAGTSTKWLVESSLALTTSQARQRLVVRRCAENAELFCLCLIWLALLSVWMHCSWLCAARIQTAPFTHSVRPVADDIRGRSLKVATQCEASTHDEIKQKQNTETVFQNSFRNIWQCQIMFHSFSCFSQSASSSVVFFPSTVVFFSILFLHCAQQHGVKQSENVWWQNWLVN